jgi:ascorbate-specific PTS system EIIC-type component UlaA
VVINGAGVITVLPIRIAPEAKLGGALAFLLGILAALGAGLWSLYAFKRVSIMANTMMGYWLTVAGDGQRVAALEATMKSHMDQAIGSRATHLFVFVSVAAFLGGCAFTGWGLLS